MIPPVNFWRTNMKITIINGQTHKGSSYNIGKMLADKLACNDLVTEYFLPRDLNHFCLGCYKCIEDITKCPFYDEKKIILDSMEKSDLIVFTTPNYCFGPSAQLKAFIDLFFDFWMPHRPLPWMFKKKAVVISTCAGGGAKQATKYIKKALIYMGVPYVKMYYTAVQAMNWKSVDDKKKENIEKDIDKLAKRVAKVETPKPGIKSKFLFMIFKNMHSGGFDSSPVEKQYWIEQGFIKTKDDKNK